MSATFWSCRRQTVRQRSPPASGSPPASSRLSPRAPSAASMRPVPGCPASATQRARQAALPDATTLAASLAQAIDGTPFRPDTFAPFLTDVEAARRQPLLQRGDLNGTSLALRLDSLLVEAGDRWLAMLPLRGVANPQAVATAIAGFDDVGLVFLDLKAESDLLLGTYLHEALNLSFAGSVAIVILLSISLRSLRRTVAVRAATCCRSDLYRGAPVDGSRAGCRFSICSDCSWSRRSAPTTACSSSAACRIPDELAQTAHDRLARTGRSLHRDRFWDPVVLVHSGAARDRPYGGHRRLSQPAVRRDPQPATPADQPIGLRAAGTINGRHDGHTNDNDQIARVRHRSATPPLATGHDGGRRDRASRLHQCLLSGAQEPLWTNASTPHFIRILQSIALFRSSIRRRARAWS